MSTAIIGLHDFDAWGISHKFMTAFEKDWILSGNLKATQIENEI